MVKITISHTDAYCYTGATRLNAVIGPQAATEKVEFTKKENDRWF